MSQLLELEQGAYQAPEGLMDFADREVDGKKIILYIGDKALLDIVKKGYIDVVEEVEVPDILLRRIETEPQDGVNIFKHPASYLSAEEEMRIFDRNNPALNEAA